MNFERGKDPRSTMRIGLETKLDNLVKESIERHKFNMCNASVRSEERVRIIGELGIPVGLEVRDDDAGRYFLIVTCIEIGYKKEFSIDGFAWPTMQKVAARTMAMDLVPVQPMAAPKGELFYLDYRYGRNWWQRISDKIRDIFRKKPTHLS